MNNKFIVAFLGLFDGIDTILREIKDSTEFKDIFSALSVGISN